MKVDTFVLEPVENEAPEQEQLRIKKVAVGAFEGELVIEQYGSIHMCGTCSNTGCATMTICSDGCFTNV